MNGKHNIWERGQAMMEYAVLFPMAIGILIVAGSIGYTNRMMYAEIVNAFVQPGIEETCEPIDEGPTVVEMEGHRIELCGAVYNEASDVTTITYCVETATNADMCHWTLGVGRQFANSIISVSGEDTWTWTDGDSTTGTSGVRFGEGVPGQCRPHGDNGVGNGVDDQPPGEPPVNDGEGTGPGNPGNRGGADPSDGNNGNGGNQPTATEEPTAEVTGQEVAPGVYAQDLDVCWFADNNNGGEYVWYMYNPNSAPLIQGEQKKVMFEWYTHRNNGNRSPIQSGQNYDQTGWHRQSTNTQGSYFTIDWYLWDNGFVQDLGTKTIRATEDYRCHFYPNTPSNNTPPQAASLTNDNGMALMSRQNNADTAALKSLNLGNMNLNDDVWNYNGTANDILILATGKWEANEGTVTVYDGTSVQTRTISLPVQVTDNCEE